MCTAGTIIKGNFVAGNKIQANTNAKLAGDIVNSSEERFEQYVVSVKTSLEEILLENKNSKFSSDGYYENIK